MLDDAYTHHDEPEKSYFSLAVRLIFRFIIDDDQWYPRHVYNNIRRDRDLIIGIGYRWAIVGFCVFWGNSRGISARTMSPPSPFAAVLGSAWIYGLRLATLPGDHVALPGRMARNLLCGETYDQTTKRRFGRAGVGAQVGCARVGD